MAILKNLALLVGILLLTQTATAGTKIWAVGGGDTNWSSLNNWSPAVVPVAGDDVLFVNDGGNAAIKTNNAVDPGFSAQIRSLMYGQTNCNHGTVITAPALVVNGTASSPNPLFVGTGNDGDAAATNLTMISGTALTINNPNSPIIVRQAGSVSASTHRAILNMTGLNTFTANVLAFYTAWENDGLLSDRRPCGTVFFGKTNYITCTSSGIGFDIGQVVQTGGAASTNRLGQANFINVNSLRVGGAKTANSALNFNTGWVNPTATFRNAAGTGRATAWYIGDNDTGSSTSASTAFMDLSGGTVDALVGTIYVGRGQPSSNTGDGTGTLVLKLGTIDTDTMEIGYQRTAGGSVGKGTVRVDGGLLKVNKDLRLGYAISGSTDGSGLLVVNSGTVTVAGNVLNGGYTSTITVTNNGTLNLRPAGDLVAGNVAATTLNIGAGAVTNFGTLSFTSLNVLSPANQFTVYSGQALGALGVGTATVNTNLTLTNASVVLDLGTPTGNDQLAVNANLTLEGTNYVIVNPGNSFGAGTYSVMTYGLGGGGGVLTGDVVNNLKVGGAMGDSRYTLYFDASMANTINLNVSGGPAQSVTWSGDGVGNVWDLHQTFNWTDGALANNAKFYNLDSATFDDGGSANPAVNLVTNVLPNQVTLNGTKSYTFSGTGKITGGASLTHNSTGTLTILTTNDYTGTTTINSGTLQIGNGSTADGAVGTGDIYNNSALVLNSAGSQSILGVITGAGSIIKRGPGVTLLGGYNTFSTWVTNEAGTLLLGTGDSLGDTGSGTVINNGATLDLGGKGTGSEPIYASGTGVGGAGAIVNSGPLAGASSYLNLTGPTTFGGTVGWTLGSINQTTGFQANSNTVTKIGSNSLQFTHAGGTGYTWDYTADGGFGDMDVKQGTFSLNGYVSLGDPAGTFTISSNATLEINNTGDYLTSKKLVFENGAKFASTLPNRLLPQYCTIPGPVSLGGAVSFNVVGTDTVNFTNEISGTGPLNVVNVGLLTFAASNSFTGDLSIQAGTVALTGEGSVTRAANIILASTTLDVSNRVDSTLTLASGQSLKGSGAIRGSLVAPAGSILTPGASVGAISVTSDATLRGSTLMEMSKVAAVYTADLLAVAGTLDLGGSLTVTYSGDNLQPGDTFTLFGAGTFNNAFSSVTLPSIAGVVWTNMTAIDGTVRVLSAPLPPQPTFSSANQLTNGSLQLNFNGSSGYSYSVWAADTVDLPLSNWQVIGSGTFSAGAGSFTDANAPSHQQRFYQITIP